MTNTTTPTPWNYIPLSQLMNSVKEDLHMYDEANLIDEDRVIKIIAQCNEKLGERIYKSKECKLIVKDYRAEMPSDLWKIENIFAISTKSTDYTYSEGGGIIGATQVVYTDYQPPKIISGDKIIPIKCSQTKCCDAEYVSCLDKKEAQLMYKDIFPLILSSSVSNRCTNYSPCKGWQGQYQVDLEDGEFRFSFKEGEVYISYLGDMTNEDGELVIPFHPLLNQYYEYAAKAKIAEDIYINSEADIIQRLQYFKSEASKAYYDAYSFVQSAKAGQWSKMRKQRQMEFYNKWYSMF